MDSTIGLTTRLDWSLFCAILNVWVTYVLHVRLDFVTFVEYMLHICTKIIAHELYNFSNYYMYSNVDSSPMHFCVDGYFIHVSGNA